ncbi:MAG: hypothetical protein E3K37_05090 [Candidatus Kuenenia sp.]|nr:hypothetical protein [Candidatus Kuenenia hertensis]
MIKKQVRILMQVLTILLVLYDITSITSFAENDLNDAYTIGPEDILEIQVWDNEDLNRTVEISQDGTFTFPLIGRVRAEGSTVFELEELIEKKLLDDGFLVSPHVTIGVKEYKSQKVFVLGEISKPGCYVLKRSINILDIISQAGGITDKAGKIITIVRPKYIHGKNTPSSAENNTENEIFTVNLNDLQAAVGGDLFFVKNDDTIYINSVSRIFVTGEVKKPGEHDWESGLTVYQAIALAGGTTEKASPRRAIVIRAHEGKEKRFEAKMDVQVKPGDIINVPQRYF